MIDGRRPLRLLLPLFRHVADSWRSKDLATMSIDLFESRPS
ncbi:hypothetical protein [Sphingomonas sp.]|nr:hypothetical protein [Sphingomonas sp.]